MNKVLILAVLLASGCNTVQTAAQKAAAKYGLEGELRKFREAEGKAVGMISINGKDVRYIYVDRDGKRYTNGVYARIIIDEEIVKPDATPIGTGGEIPVTEPVGEDAPPAGEADDAGTENGNGIPTNPF